MPEQTLRCPGCGAPANADAAACSYCGSALATVTCASCYGAMFAGSRFCAHCGAEAVREEVEERAPLRCPRCKEEEMRSLLLGKTKVRECGACGGLWMAPADLQALADTKELHSGIVAVLAAHAPSAPALPDVIRYLPCPECGKLMNRSNFAKSSGVVLDVCKTHGVWLDRGELPALLAFIGGGGLARARARDHMMLEEERRRIEALKGTISTPHESYDTGSFTRVSGDSDGAVVFSRILRTLFTTISE
jgi:Zn-finger nucleic acid-binding protein